MRADASRTHHTVVCGGGFAGLAAALWLGRYRRKTLLVDEGSQRNLPSERSHGYLTQDGRSPRELLAAASEDVSKYPTVERTEGPVTAVERSGDGFIVDVRGTEHSARRILFATGVEDAFPDVPGFKELYGTALFHCPCCDGYEARDQNVLAIGWGEHVAGYSLDLLDWGARVTVVTNGEQWEGTGACSVALARHGVEVSEERISSFEVAEGKMRGALLASGRSIAATMAFFSIAHRPRSGLAADLGCDIDQDGYIVVGAHGETSIEGVYAAGDVTPGEQLVQAAAAEGAIAGIACAMSLRGETAAPGAPHPGPDPEAEIPPPA
jgi:thioredoxin reductase